jgi:hypothetical protein
MLDLSLRFSVADMGKIRSLELVTTVGATDRNDNTTEGFCGIWQWEFYEWLEQWILR